MLESFPFYRMYSRTYLLTSYNSSFKVNLKLLITYSYIKYHLMNDNYPMINNSSNIISYIIGKNISESIWGQISKFSTKVYNFRDCCMVQQRETQKSITEWRITIIGSCCITAWVIKYQHQSSEKLKVSSSIRSLAWKASSARSTSKSQTDKGHSSSTSWICSSIVRNHWIRYRYWLFSEAYDLWLGYL